MQKRKILVTSALPYANGSLHLGHLVEHVQSDIWVRYQKLRGHDCVFVCGDDAHGTPIMLNAMKQGITPEELVAKMYQEHQQDLKDFSINYDNFYTTHSDENKQLACEIYTRLEKRGDIIKKTIRQAYDPKEHMFLPDRYVQGECPRCGAKDQYGDSCEACGATYSPSELKNARSVISGETPIEKESEHYFFDLQNYEALLKQWLEEGHIQEQIANKLKEWFEAGLQPWDISRDAPYFGFEIPNAPGKYFYVWLDAPIGYMASFKNLCDKRGDLNFDDYWGENSKAEVVHFVGKDIIYFHALFWPAMLHGAGFRLPTEIHTHGFLTIDGAKMSKSRGTFITVRHYLNYLEPEYLRYYFAAKLNDRIDDLDLNFDDFVQRVNSDLVGKVVNIASRCAGFIRKGSNNQLAETCLDESLYQEFVRVGDNIATLFEKRNYNQAIREIMALADKANHFIDKHEPWVLAKQEGKEKDVQAICSLGINLFRVIMIYLTPILPEMSAKVAEFLNEDQLTWQGREQPLLNHTINKFKPLMQRIDLEKIAELKDGNK